MSIEYDVILNKFKQGVEIPKSTVYAYLSTPATTTCASADTWYIFNSTFTNTIVNHFTVAADGITYTGESAEDFEAEWKFCGQSNITTKVQIAIALNATFDVDGTLLTGTILSGSCGSDEADTVAQTNGFISPHSLWAGELEKNDMLTLVIKAGDANTVITPTQGAASIHKFH